MTLESTVPEWRETSESEFPYAGTVSGFGSGMFRYPVRIKQCQDCRRSRARWLREPGHSPEAALAALRTASSGSCAETAHFTRSTP